MGECNVFTEIMELIEKRTNIPTLEKDLENWLFEKEENKKIYQIYRLASELREL